MTFNTLNRSYVPVTSELEDAVAEILKEHEDEHINTKTVRLLLMMKHDNWRLPERRVRKFVKRYLNLPEDDDSSIQSASSTSSSVMSALARRVGAYAGYSKPLSTRTIPEQSTPTTVSSDTAASLNEQLEIPISILPEAETTAEAQFSPLEGGGASPFPEGKNGTSVSPFVKRTNNKVAKGFHYIVNNESLSEFDASTSAVNNVTNQSGFDPYEDDNDGKKENGWCEPCEGCIIL